MLSTSLPFDSTCNVHAVTHKGFNDNMRVEILICECRYYSMRVLSVASISGARCRRLSIALSGRKSIAHLSFD